MRSYRIPEAISSIFVSLCVSAAIPADSWGQGLDFVPEASEECHEANVSMLQIGWTWDRLQMARRGSASESGSGLKASVGKRQEPPWDCTQDLGIANWTWRNPVNVSLVALNSTALGQIGVATEQPFMGDLPDAEYVQLDIAHPPSASNDDPLICSAYHKTGKEVCHNFLAARLNVTSECYIDCDYSSSDCSEVLQSHANDIVYANYDLSHIPAGPFRLLNWIRDPIDIILSAFRYHMLSPELWCLLPTCMGCSASGYDTIFGLCAENCSYVELLTSVASVNETAGVIVEAINERSNIQNMFNVTTMYANDARFLHLSVDHLKVDFDQTMRCINAFLGAKGLPLEKLQTFETFSHASGKSDPHVTTGKYNNALLKHFLRSLPVWGPEFTKMGEVINRIFQRQADSYGCPMPH